MWRFCLIMLAVVGAAPDARAEVSRFFTTSDGVRLHVTEAGRGPLLVLVPGWTMPAWIWGPQLAFFQATHRVVALDPRGQGQSQVAAGGYTPARRGRDIAELLAALGGGRAAVVGWSLGVLDLLSMVRAEGDAALSAVVLVDNSIGEGPPPVAGNGRFLNNLRTRRAETTRGFVASMFRLSPGPDYLERLTQDSLRTPTPAAIQLLSYPVPREAWRDAVHGLRAPVLYAVTPRFAGQARELAAGMPGAETEVFEGAGHALFVDAAAAFNARVADFLRRRAR